MKVSERYKWTFRDSFYQLVLNPENYLPGFILGVLYAVGVIYWSGMSDNPLLSFFLQVLSIIVLYIMGCVAWEYVQYRKMSEAEKDLHWEIDGKTVKRKDGTGQEKVYYWSRIQRVKRTMSGYMLHRSNGGPIWLPIKIFTPDEAHAFEDRLSEKQDS